MGRGAPALLGLLVFDHSITLFPFKYLSSPILSLFLPLMVMPKVVLKNSGQKLCFFAHLVLYLHNAIKHLVSRVLRDSIPRFVHPLVGRSFGRLVGWLVPILLFGIFVDMDESTLFFHCAYYSRAR